MINSAYTFQSHTIQGEKEKVENKVLAIRVTLTISSLVHEMKLRVIENSPMYITILEKY